MADATVPESVRTLADRADWFQLQVGATLNRLEMLVGLQDFPEAWADWLFLISDELRRNSDAFGPVIKGLRALETSSSDDSEASRAV